MSDPAQDLSPILGAFETNIAHPIRLGINSVSGIKTPLGRLGVYVAAYSAYLWAAKPDRCFVGPSPRPWLVLRDADSSTGTYVPWWLEAFAVAYAVHLYI